MRLLSVSDVQLWPEIVFRASMERRSRLELALIVALCGGCTSLAALLYTRASKLTKELAMAKAALEKQTGLRAEER